MRGGPQNVPDVYNVSLNNRTRPFKYPSVGNEGLNTSRGASI